MVHHAAIQEENGRAGVNEPRVDQDARAALALERGRLLFAGECRFVWAATSLDVLPPAGLPEVAFAGRSNVGKSSLVNALTGQNKLARTSRTPGRTQQINFFEMDGRLLLVDLPGYGYAVAAKDRIAAWTTLVEDYLKGRPTLRRLCLLIDARHGLKDADRRIMTLLDRAAVSYIIVATKCDAPKPAALEACLAAIAAEAANHPAAHPLILATSAVTGAGIDRLRAELATVSIAA
ncbi:MAG: YihA family ribosome biogenesis GTP-binding protein [Alphaproteobacteria bacterium]|nr:YihA family ribosome biogenesis GTP-binding protein [Alphaproteobacteria bacterium]